MSDKVNIRYGDSDLSLAKSDELIAVKPRPGVAFDGVRRLSGVPAVELGNLGGFRLVKLTDPAANSTAEVIEALRHDSTVAHASEVFYTSDDRVPFVPTGQLYVVVQPGADKDALETLFEKHALNIVEARDEGEFILQITPKSPSAMTVVQDLQSQPALIKIAEPDLATFGELKTVSGFALPSDELLSDQWHLENRGKHYGTTVGFKEGADARVVRAWNAARTFGYPNVIVAVIDDGFDLAHPDLGGSSKVVAPFDFTRNTSAPTPDWETQDWHGTACAGVAVGTANGKGILGAAPGCRLMPVRWGTDLSDVQIERWFGWVSKQGAWVVSCSWGAAANVFKLSSRMLKAITKCAKNGRGGLGTVICFAAGNDNHDVNDLPRSLDGFAIHPDVIAVAACNSRDRRSDYSNFGKEIWIAAPSSGAGGWGITTSDVTGTYVTGGYVYPNGYAAGDYTAEFGGTSSACPLVAGICALILSVRPDLTAQQVREILRDTARRIGGDHDTTGHSTKFGYGCVDAEAAVRATLNL